MKNLVQPVWRGRGSDFDHPSGCGFEWRGSLGIPMFQFDANDLALKAGVQSVRVELPSLWSGWNVASWFSAPLARRAHEEAAHV